MDDLKTPASTAVAATTAYTPGWMFHESGMDIMRFSPTMPPKDAPTCDCTTEQESNKTNTAKSTCKVTMEHG